MDGTRFTPINIDLGQWTFPHFVHVHTVHALVNVDTLGITKVTDQSRPQRIGKVLNALQ